MVDGLAHGPERRHRDELGLHPAPGRAFRVVQAALQRDALGRRQLLEDLGLVLLRQVFQDVDRVVGVHVADALGDGLGRQLFENLLAHRVVDFGQGREVEGAAHELDQARAQLGVERFQNRADIGLMQVADQRRQRRLVAGLDCLGHALDEFRAQRALLVAQRRRIRRERRRRGHVFFVEHGDLGGKSEREHPLLRRAPARGNQRSETR